MSKQSEAVKKWRATTKQRMVESMGGGCQCCGYSRCLDCLDFHHLDPSQKEISFGKIMANPRNWSSMVTELKKCILVCRICHGEIHAGIREIPIEYVKFNEAFSDYRALLRGKEEREVKQLLENNSIEEIARKLNVSTKTIERRKARFLSGDKMAAQV